MNRQEALAHVMTLAVNNISNPQIAADKDFWFVIDDMHSSIIMKYKNWLEQNNFIKEIY